jgi:hypothetical protein
VQAADVERVWQHRSPEATVTSQQRAPGDAELATRTAVTEAKLAMQAEVIADLRARLAEAETRAREAERERRETTERALALIEAPAGSGKSWWRRWWRT